MSYTDYLAHHGIKKMKWGKRNGPPYPLKDEDRSQDERNANPISPSAKMLSRIELKDDRTSSSSKSSGGSKDYGDNTRSSNQLTTESRIEWLKRTGKLKVAEKKTSSEKSEESSKKKTSGSKSSKSSGKSDAEKAAEKAAKEAEKQRKAEEKERADYLSKGKKAINDAFNGNISQRSFKNMLDEFMNGGVLDKNLDGTNSTGSDDLTGENFYSKLLSKMDPKSSEYAKIKEEYDKIKAEAKLESTQKKETHEGQDFVATTDRETGKKVYKYLDKEGNAVATYDEDPRESSGSALKRLSRAVSMITDYADYLEKKSPSEINKIHTQVLGLLDDKLKWFAEKRTNSSSGKGSTRERESYAEIEEYLKKLGF